MVVSLMCFSFLNGQFVIEIKNGALDTHTACYAKLVKNALYWKDCGNLILAQDCFQIALVCLKSMSHDAIIGGDDETCEYAREAQTDVEYYLHEVQEELRLINLDINDSAVPPENKQRLIRSLKYMKKVAKAFWEEWAKERAFLVQPQEPLISNMTEKEFTLQLPPHKVKKDNAKKDSVADSSPKDVCTTGSSSDGCGASHRKRKAE